METELWPNLLHSCGARKIPVMVANARLSERSARGYGKLATLTRTMLADISMVAAQQQTDAERFIHLGLAREKLAVTGSIKFDLDLDDDYPSIRLLCCASNGHANESRKIWLAASTHPGEDEIILQAFASLKKKVSPIYCWHWYHDIQSAFLQ
jgi:3-deoxy-D-manno-octulosonic-acid transferase